MPTLNGKMTDENGNVRNVTITIATEDFFDDKYSLHAIGATSKLFFFANEVSKVDDSYEIDFAKDDSHGKYEYSIKTIGKKYVIFSSTILAAQSGAFRLMRELGIYHFAPVEGWFVYPSSLKSVTVEKTSPSFTNRNMFLTYGHGFLSQTRGIHTKQFFSLNCMDQVNGPVGHSWGNIINRNKQAFVDNPNLYSDPSEADKAENNRNLNIVDDGGEDTEHHNALVELVKADRTNLLAEYRKIDPERNRVPLDPKDGSQYSSDEVVAFNNAVCEALAEFDGEAGMYAYAGHRAPPSIDCAPNLHVQLALAFNRSDMTYEEILAGWKDKCQNVGLREYWSVPVWDHGMPSLAKMFSFNSMLNFYRKHNQESNVISIHGESTAFWPAYSLGFFGVASILDDSSKTNEEIRDLFFEKCFNNNQDIIALFKYWEDVRTTSPFMFYNSFMLIESAMINEDDDLVKKRILDLRDYLFIQNMYRKVQNLTKHSPEYFDALQAYMERVWTYRESGIVHFYGVARNLCNANVTRSDRYDLYIFRERDFGEVPVWQVEKPILEDEYESMISSLAEEVDFTRYSEDLVVMNDLPGFPETNGDDLNHDFRYRNRFYATAGTRIRVTAIDGQGGISVGMSNNPDEQQTLIPKGGQEDFEILDSSVFIINGAKFNVKIIEGNICVNCSPENPAWIDNGGSNLWGFSDSEEMHIDSDVRSTTMHLLDGVNVRYDVTRSTRQEGETYSVIQTQPNSVYMVHAINQRGSLVIYNQPQWISFKRDEIFIPIDVL